MDRIERLLAANNLPQEDLRATPVSFLLATDGGDVVGIGAVEAHGSQGLLRRFSGGVATGRITGKRARGYPADATVLRALSGVGDLPAEACFAL